MLNNFYFTAFAFIVSMGVSLASGINASAADTLQERVYSIFDNNRDSIVKVYAQKNVAEDKGDKTSKPRTVLDVGSGFIIGKDGIVMTSAFVTYGADKIWIEYKGLTFDASLVGFDPLTTLSIVKISGDFKAMNASIIPIDAGAQLPKIGTILVSLSYEMGLPVSPRFGLAMGHNIEFGGTFLPTVYLRSSIPAARGATGGAIFDISGKFAGMTVAALPELGGSFIIPAKAAARIRDDILLCGEPVYSWFGLRAEDIGGLTNTKVLVTLVAENAPAKKAGFMIGDEIMAINSTPVANNTQLRNSTFFVRPGETATFKIRRASKIMSIEVLAERMSPDILHASEAALASKNTANKSPDHSFPVSSKK